MKRILTYPILEDANGSSILEFLKQKHYSRSVIVQLKKTENGILIDGKWAYVNHILKKGELLTIQLIEPGEKAAKTPAIQEKPPFSIVYEDQDLLVADKPAGMPVHPSVGHDKNTLADAVCDYAAQKQESYPFRCINRLDRDTSGMTIIAKNAYSSCILYEQMRKRKIGRTYYAIAAGSVPIKGTISAPIARREHTIIERTVDAAGEPAVTHFQTLFYGSGLSFVKLWLDTGRTHQIRVHMRHIGHPLIGDFLYNPGDDKMQRQALHAGTLRLLHPVSGQPMVLCAPLPQDMKAAAEAFFPAAGIFKQTQPYDAATF